MFWCFRFMQMLGTIVVLLVLVVAVVPQERPPLSDIEPKRPIGGGGGDWPIRNPQQWDNNVIIHEA
jgi:hypothetical protein